MNASNNDYWVLLVQLVLVQLVPLVLLLAPLVTPVVLLVPVLLVQVALVVPLVLVLLLELPGSRYSLGSSSWTSRTFSFLDSRDLLEVLGGPSSAEREGGGP